MLLPLILSPNAASYFLQSTKSYPFSLKTQLRLAILCENFLSLISKELVFA